MSIPHPRCQPSLATAITQTAPATTTNTAITTNTTTTTKNTITTNTAVITKTAVASTTTLPLVTIFCSFVDPLCCSCLLKALICLVVNFHQLENFKFACFHPYSMTTCNCHSNAIACSSRSSCRTITLCRTLAHNYPRNPHNYSPTC